MCIDIECARSNEGQERISLYGIYGKEGHLELTVTGFWTLPDTTPHHLETAGSLVECVFQACGLVLQHEGIKPSKV